MVTERTFCALLLAAVLFAPVRAEAQSGDAAAEPVDAIPGPEVVEAAPPPDLSEVSVELELPEPLETALGLPIEIGVRLQVPSHLELATLTVGGNRYIELLDATEEPLEGGVATRTVRLAVFRTGDFQSSGIEAVLIDDAGRQHRVSSAPFLLSVVSRIINETDPVPAPSDPPLTVLSRDMRPIYAGSALGFLGLGALIAALWRRRNEPDEEVEVAPELRRPAWEVAFEQLDELKSEGMLEEGRHLDFHMRLSEIVREYIGRRFSFLALEMTTTEIARALQDKDAGEYREELLEVLGDMDLVKFAKFTPPVEMSESSFDSVHKLIEELSARERQLAASGAPISGDPALSGASAAVSETSNPHAPSPESTTTAFQGDGEEEGELPENVVAFPGEADRASAPSESEEMAVPFDDDVQEPKSDGAEPRPDVTEEGE